MGARISGILLFLLWSGVLAGHLTSIHDDGDVMQLKCEGDCDDDDDCAGDLKCFFRDAMEHVPGCTGLGQNAWDYCTDMGVTRNNGAQVSTASPTFSPTEPPVPGPTPLPTPAPTSAPTAPPTVAVAGAVTVTTTAAAAADSSSIPWWALLLLALALLCCLAIAAGALCSAKKPKKKKAKKTRKVLAENFEQPEPVVEPVVEAAPPAMYVEEVPQVMYPVQTVAMPIAAAQPVVQYVEQPVMQMVQQPVQYVEQPVVQMVQQPVQVVEQRASQMIPIVQQPMQILEPGAMQFANTPQFVNAPPY